MTNPTHHYNIITVMSNTVTKHKKFPTPEDATAWINAQPKGTQVVFSTAHEGEQVLYYREPQDLRSEQIEALQRRINEHINYPPEIRKNLGYYHTIIELPAAQLSLIINGTRNLKCFKGAGLAKADIINLIVDAGFKVYDPLLAREKFGCRAALIIHKSHGED